MPIPGTPPITHGPSRAAEPADERARGQWQWKGIWRALLLRMPLNERLYLLGVAGLAQPGHAMRAAAAGSASKLTTLHAQLFWTF